MTIPPSPATWRPRSPASSRRRAPRAPRPTRRRASKFLAVGVRAARQPNCATAKASWPISGRRPAAAGRKTAARTSIAPATSNANSRASTTTCATRGLAGTSSRSSCRTRRATAPSIDQTGQSVLRGEDRLAAAQQELVAALARYSEDHPDVRRLRREIATLTSETGGSPDCRADQPDLPAAADPAECGRFGHPRADRSPLQHVERAGQGARHHLPVARSMKSSTPT